MEKRKGRPTVTIAQSQASLLDQLKTLRDLANAHGLYDAADWLKRHALQDKP